MLWLLASSICSACRGKDARASFSGLRGADRLAKGVAENDNIHSVIPAFRADGKDLKCVLGWEWAARRQKEGCT